MNLGKRLASALLAQCMLIPALLPAAMAEGNTYAKTLEDSLKEPSIEYRTELRWWMAEGAHTDETLEKEVQAIYDAGFRGIEMAQLNETLIDGTVYGYGSEQWNHDFHVVLNKALDLGMTVGITSGTNWNTTNVPGLDPDSQGAMQGVFASAQAVAGGQSISGKVPNTTFVKGSFGAPDQDVPVNDVNRFIGAYAFAVENAQESPIRLRSADFIDLTSLVVEDADGDECLEWTAPDGTDYYVFYYWQQGTAQLSRPSVEPSYCINYYDIRGFEAFKEYFAANVLNDPELNAKILAGDVQLFMDSLEINRGNCVTYWTEDFAQEFEARKGYDIRPYLFLNIGLPVESELARFSPEPPAFGTYNVENDELGMKLLNDLRDVHTQLYLENYMNPIREWLHQYGIRLRAQISYGRYIEISEPIVSVDYPEAENLNQRNQVDIYRLWTGGSKLQNKVLSSETGALGGFGYSYDHQKHLQEAYSLYAAGFSRINWHIWTSSWAPETVSYLQWPGFQSWPFGPFFNPNFHTFGTRLPEYNTYWEFNQHLGRVQKVLREGVSRTDVGMIYQKFDQHVASACLPEDDMWMQRHDYMLFPSTKLQENGYTYDYFSPDFLTAEGVSYNAETGKLEQAGYKALVLWQSWLDADAAQVLLDLAKQGMKLVIVDGAAESTVFADGRDGEMKALVQEMKSLSNVKTVANADAVLDALRELDVTPYAAFAEENQQLLTQVRQDDNGNLYLYAYNYCDGSLHDGDDPDHGTLAKAEISMDGIFVPYQIDTWTGNVTRLAEYRHENGRTIFPLELAYSDIALLAFEKSDDMPKYVVTSNGGSVFEAADGSIVQRVTQSGAYTVQLSDGTEQSSSVSVPAAYDVTDWDVTVEAWSAGEEKLYRTDSFTDSMGNTSVEYTYDTIKTNTNVKLDRLTTWDQIPEVGQGVSGRGYYRAQFDWSGEADGAYLNFGTIVGGMKVTINGQHTADVNMNIPVLDITAYLVPGANTIELEYNSNLANELIKTGILKEGAASWAGYEIAYRSYGPTQAVVVPYVDILIK